VHPFRSSIYWLKSFLRVCLLLRESFRPGYELGTVESRWANLEKFITVHAVSLTTESGPTHRMNMSQITFHGTVGTVTGSRFLLDASGSSVLIDCGTLQGVQLLRRPHWDTPPLGVKLPNGIVLSQLQLNEIHNQEPRCVGSSRATRTAWTAPARRIPSFKLNDCEGRHS
jgi:hypothetical protein